MGTDADWLVTREDLRRFEAVVYDAIASLLRASVAAVPANPDGYAFYDAGGVQGMLTTNPYAGFFRWAHGLTRCSDDAVAGALKFFKEHGVKARLRIAPDGMHPARAKLLAQAGSMQTGFHTVLYAPLTALTRALPVTADPDITIEEVQAAGPVEDFLDVQLRGFNVPATHVERLKVLRRCWINTAGHRSYLAKINGEPAAHAMLYESGEISYLSGASTLAEYRRRGLQTALIRRRIADARSAGARMILGAADFESNSRLNMMRCGLHIAYTAAWWDEV